jgi:hypothetical protein
MIQTRKYREGEHLAENEYLLKIRKSGQIDTGYMSKLNQDGSIPKNFSAWGVPDEEPSVFTEEYRSGWKGIRYGKSQNWAILMHPMGFTVEIYASQPHSWQNSREGMSFEDILKNCVIELGILQGKFMWKKNTLLLKEKPNVVSHKENAIGFMQWAMGGECLYSLSDDDEWTHDFSSERITITTEELYKIYMDDL